MTARGPLPGMDPWLEQFWGDVHLSLCDAARDRLNQNLAPGLVARAQEQVYIVSSLAERRRVIPDVHVVQRGHARPVSSPGAAGGASVVLVAEPELIHMPTVELREHFIEIIDLKANGRVISVIEFVSWTNKHTKAGRRKYLQKQRETLSARANLVEVDLLRGGRGVTRAARDPRATATPYHACATRGRRRDVVEFYGLPLRGRLPAIGIPLRDGEHDVPLDLQLLVDEAYRRGKYRELIDYGQPAVPPLSGDELAWARQLVETWRSIPG